MRYVCFVWWFCGDSGLAISLIWWFGLNCCGGWFAVGCCVVYAFGVVLGVGFVVDLVWWLFGGFVGACFLGYFVIV